jgi:hypothetical protein
VAGEGVFAGLPTARHAQFAERFVVLSEAEGWALLSTIPPLPVVAKLALPRWSLCSQLTLVFVGEPLYLRIAMCCPPSILVALLHLSRLLTAMG